MFSGKKQLLPEERNDLAEDHKVPVRTDELYLEAIGQMRRSQGTKVLVLRVSFNLAAKKLAREGLVFEVPETNER